MANYMDGDLYDLDQSRTLSARPSGGSARPQSPVRRDPERLLLKTLKTKMRLVGYLFSQTFTRRRLQRRFKKSMECLGVTK